MRQRRVLCVGPRVHNSGGAAEGWNKLLEPAATVIFDGPHVIYGDDPVCVLCGAHLPTERDSPCAEEVECRHEHLAALIKKITGQNK